jgi:hypothetical protein
VPRPTGASALLKVEKRIAEVRSFRNMIFGFHKFNAISKLE